jgi:hypothetical protein
MTLNQDEIAVAWQFDCNLLQYPEPLQARRFHQNPATVQILINMQKQY